MKKGWEYIELHKKCIVQNGFAFNSKEFNGVNGVPLIRIRDIKRGFSETFTSEICSSDYYVENGNLLVGMDGDFNVGIWNGGHALLNQRVCMIKPSNNYNVKFLYYYLPNILNRINQKTSFSTVKHLSSKQVNKINIPDISENEQRRIVSYLDSSFDLIDKIKENALKSLSEAKALFQSALAEAMEPKEGWEEKKLYDISIYSIGLTYKPNDVSEKGTIVLRSTNIQDDKLNFDDIVRVNTKIKDSLYVKNGDILMCSRNGSPRLVGKVAKIENISEPMTFGTFMMIIRSDYNDYLYYFFKSDCFRNQIKHGEANMINQITRYMLDDVIINLPSISEQKQIVSRLDSLSSKVRAIEEKYQKMIAEGDAMKQSMLREVFE